MINCKLKVGDNVIINTGSHKGYIGQVMKILKKKQRVLIKGINIFKKHIKPDKKNNSKGQMIFKEFPIHISNVSILDTKKRKHSRIQITQEQNQKNKFSSKSGDVIDNKI